MAMGGGSSNGPMSDINVTPLVDVMLVLLVIFMVTAPMMTTGLDVNLPQAKGGALDESKQPIIVSVNGHNDIYINERRTSLHELGSAIVSEQNKTWKSYGIIKSRSLCALWCCGSGYGSLESCGSGETGYGDRTYCRRSRRIKSCHAQW